MPDERSAGAVVYREPEQGARRYLLLHYRGGHWGHVKGHIEPGESLEETLHREAEEEAGLTDLEIQPGFSHDIAYSFHRGSQRVEKRVDFFLARTRTEEVEVRSPNEHQGLGWFTYDEAMARLTFEEAQAVLEAAEAHLAG